MFRPRSTARVLSLATVCALAIAVTAIASAGAKDTAKLLFFEDQAPAGGVSTLERNGEQQTISARINATHLHAGHAYTYWWVVFNEPAECNGPDGDPDGEPMCGENDIFVDGNPMLGFDLDQIDAVKLGLLGGNGTVANPGGRATFTGTLFAGTGAGHHVLVGPGGELLEGSPLMPDKVMTAEIHIVIRDHGPAQAGAELANQLNSFHGNCTPETSAGLGDGDYPCNDPQFAVHK